MSDISHFINGKRVAGRSESSGGRGGDVFNPATGEKVRRVAFASAADVDAAVKAAAAAFPGWAATPPLTRARILFKFLEILSREHDALARVISEEHGKVFSDAQGEITRGVEVVEFACSIPGSPRSALSARPRSPNTSTRPPPRSGNACRLWAAPRTIWSSCPMPISTRQPTP